MNKEIETLRSAVNHFLEEYGKEYKLENSPNKITK